ncbi:MAG: putative quinol monooxygenase, partial [Nitrospiria bacterium]
MAELTVVARLKAKPGREAEVERELRALVGPTHKERGCLRYALHRSVEDRATFVVIERWASKEAFDQHFAAPYVQALLKKVPELFT